MPKHEPLTPKAISNRIKAKGLQKLKWYCQMCQKQCRDENGFKCHTMSESHQRQLLLFADNPHKYIDSFSKEFLDTFIELLRRRFGTKRIHANQVYQEYITDRHHTHMNATQWVTLTDFVKWLGREGYCTVDQTEKGWFISYIDRDPETIRRQEELAKKERLERDDTERMAKFLEKQIKRGKTKDQAPKEVVYTELKKASEEEKVAFSLASAAKPPAKETKLENKNPLEKPPEKEAEKHGMKRKLSKSTIDTKSSKQSALDELIKEQEMLKEKKNRKDYWLHPGIVVKVIVSKLGEKYYKKKGVVQEVKDLYVGIIKMLDSGDVLKVDQAHLETVIPQPGRKVRVVNGAYRGCDAILESVNVEKFCASVKIDSGPLRGRLVDGLAYEDICKIHSA